MDVCYTSVVKSLHTKPGPICVPWYTHLVGKTKEDVWWARGLFDTSQIEASASRSKVKKRRG